MLILTFETSQCIRGSEEYRKWRAAAPLHKENERQLLPVIREVGDACNRGYAYLRAVRGKSAGRQSQDMLSLSVSISFASSCELRDQRGLDVARRRSLAVSVQASQCSFLFSYRSKAGIQGLKRSGRNPSLLMAFLRMQSWQLRVHC